MKSGGEPRRQQDHAGRHPGARRRRGAEAARGHEGDDAGVGVEPSRVEWAEGWEEAGGGRGGRWRPGVLYFSLGVQGPDLTWVPFRNFGDFLGLDDLGE